MIRDGGSSLDAVEAAVRSLETDPAFDAGIGSVLNADGAVEMDAVIINGANLSLVTLRCVSTPSHRILDRWHVFHIEHPVRLAAVMERTAHVMLVVPVLIGSLEYVS